MPIAEESFTSEQELQNWVFSEIRGFFGECILLPGFRITTPSGKHGIPDGFAFNFSRRSWWIIECELLSHGVWPHIAEQLTRFVVASRNGLTLRQVRDKVFEAIVTQELETNVAEMLDTNGTRLFQKIELFIESVTPSLAVFIDESSQDLTDFCDALDVPTEIYRVRKLNMSGNLGFYSPDQNLPIAVTNPDEANLTGSTGFTVIEQLGGGEVVNRQLQIYKLVDGRKVKIQYSKLHERHQAYWYGIKPSSFDAARQAGCSHAIFVMGQEGFADLPLDVVDRYAENAYVTNDSDGSVRHYHMHISPPPQPVLKGYGNAPDVDVSEYFSPLS